MEYILHFRHANRESKYIIYRYLILKGTIVQPPAFVEITKNEGWSKRMYVCFPSGTFPLWHKGKTQPTFAGCAKSLNLLPQGIKEAWQKSGCYRMTLAGLKRATYQSLLLTLELNILQLKLSLKDIICYAIVLFCVHSFWKTFTLAVALLHSRGAPCLISRWIGLFGFLFVCFSPPSVEIN